MDLGTSDETHPGNADYQSHDLPSLGLALFAHRSFAVPTLTE